MVDDDNRADPTVELLGPRPDVAGRRVRLDGVLAAVLGDAPPPMVGRYRIEQLVGVGGMGMVYRGHDPAHARPVAIKLLAAAGERARFAREARLLGTIDHPAVVRYLDHGVTEAGVDYLVMEWLDGCDLAARLARGRLSPAAALAIVAAAAAGLGAAHAAGVIHRDVKPSNLFLVGARDDDLRVMDFGIARTTRASGSQLTRTGAAIGTPAYMAPEQLRGEHDPRTDVYGLGATLFECLTGRPPFVGEHPAAVMLAVVAEPAPAVSAFLPDVAPALDALVARMLAKDLRDRPRDMAAVIADIAQLADRGPQTPRGLSRAERTPSRAAPRPAPAATALTGRARELALAQGVLAECADDEVARLIVIGGEPGAGKSALVDALALPPPWRLARARAEQVDAGVPYALLAALCAELADLPEAAALAAQLAQVAAGGDADPRVAADRVRLAWLTLVDDATDARPLALVIDDGHHADLSSLALIAAALDQLRDRPLGVVATTSRDAALALVIDAVPADATVAIHLGPLRARSATALAAAWSPASPAASHAEAVALAAGNPGHLRELCRDLAADRALAASSLAERMWHRLATIEPERRRVLRAAAIVGRELWLGAVAAVLGCPRDDAALAERIAALIDAGLLRRSRHQRVRGDPQLEFASELVHLAAYGLSTDDDLRAGHRAVASWLAATPGFGAAVHGHHLAAAGDLAAARPFLVAAARAALAGDDHAAVAEALARARAGLAPDQVVPELALVAAHDAFWRGDLAAADAELRAALATAPPPGLTDELRSLAITIAGQRGDNARVHDLALALADGATPRRLVGIARAATQLMVADPPRARALMQLLPGAPPEPADTELAAWWWRVHAGAQAGDSFDGAIDGFVRAQRAHLLSGDPRAAAQLDLYLGSYYAWSGAWDLARARTADATRVAQRLRAGYLIVWAAHTAAKLDVELAPPARARAALAEVIDHPVASPRMRGGAIIYDALAAMRAGDVGVALANAPRAAALATTLAAPAAAIRVRALVALGRAGEVTDADAALLAAAVAAAPRAAEFDELLHLAHAELALARADDRAPLERAAARIARFAASLADPGRRNQFLTGPHLVVQTLALATR
ncbi:MAG: protein kinase [Myxococcales bacterium]|nr:protein kinase [Myxococcales bacterium]